MFDEMRGKVVLLDNNKYYQVIWGSKIESRRVLYLLNINDFSEPLFCEMVSDAELDEIKDREFLQRVILSITKEINTFVF